MHSIMHQSSVVLGFGCFLALASSRAVEPSTQEPLPPSKDPFYTWPKGLSQARPGTVLRVRSAPGNITTVVANSSAAYNILYRTTDSNYKPSWAVTTVLVPTHDSISQKTSTNSLLSYQVPYDSVNIDASPSYGVYSALAQAVLGIPPITEDFAAMLGNGWYVNFPDYEGPLASFTLGIQAGHATIDSIRAVLSSGILSSGLDTKYALWGYSGGSLASEWAAELQEQYAPEFSFAGVALGGLVPNLTSVRDSITGTPYAGLIPSAYRGLVSQDSDAEAYLVPRLHPSGPYNASGFLAVSNYDVIQAFGAYANQKIYDYFIGGKADLEAPILQNIMNRNGYMGYHGVPKGPVFAYKAIYDEFTDFATETDALVERWCGVGVNVRYERNTVGGHIAEITNGRLRALEWLKTVFEGTVKKNGCDVRNVAVAILDTELDA